MPDYPGLSLPAIEARILVERARGLSLGEAADRLGISPEQARRHQFHAIERLGARSLLEAILIAARRGLIELPREAHP